MTHILLRRLDVGRFGRGLAVARQRATAEHAFPPRRLSPLRSPLSALLVAALLLAAALCPAKPRLLYAQQPGADAAASTAAEQQAQDDLNLVMALQRVVRRAIARCERSVVSIARKREAPDDDFPPQDFRRNPFEGFPATGRAVDPTDPNFVPNEFASGVVVDTSGLVLTNYHVLGTDSEHYVTTVDRKVFRMRVRAADPRSDLAVLEVAPNEAAPREGDFVPIVFGDAAELHKGDIVVALGNPYAIARDGQVSASWGVVSNLSRKAGAPPVPFDSEDPRAHLLQQFGTLIQTDARLNLGTSGGALVNLRGEMVGLTTSVAAIAGYDQSAGYAIPIDDTFLRILDALKQGAEVEYGFLGIRPENLTPMEIRRGLQGIRVSTVSAGTPASRAGLRMRDVITRVDGIPIYEADGLRLHVGKLPAGSTTTLTILRNNGQLLQKQVVLSKYRVRGTKIVTRPQPSWRGLRVDYPTGVIREDILSPIHDGSLVAAEVEEGSPAWKAGLRPPSPSNPLGILITHLGNTPVDDPNDFRRLVADRHGPVELKVFDPERGRQAVVVPAP